MATDTEQQTALGDVAARQLANATKTQPRMERITPRWLTQLLSWVPVEAGIYRLNRVKDQANVEVDCSERDERTLPQTCVDYEEHPREYMLSAVNTVVDVRGLKADWYVFSGHKIFAPTGIGALYGKTSLLEAAPPWQSGRNMIQDVTFESTVYSQPPRKFEAGTGNIADAVGLGAAIDYITEIGMDRIAEYEHQLVLYADRFLKEIPRLSLIGKALDREGIAVRAGHHCAQPILRRFGLEGSVRASLAFYNTCSDIDALVAVLKRLTGRATLGSSAANNYWRLPNE